MQSTHSPSQPEKDTGHSTGGVDTRADGWNDRSHVVATSVIIATAAFLLVLLIVNHALFSSPIMSYSDSAVNAMQIEKAKHFRELLGNYSRWDFHHPGPAFFYAFALGEGLFRDLLHV